MLSAKDFGARISRPLMATDMENRIHPHGTRAAQRTHALNPSAPNGCAEWRRARAGRGLPTSCYPCPQLSLGTEPIVLCGTMRRLSSFPVGVSEPSDFLVSNTGISRSGFGFGNNLLPWRSSDGRTLRRRSRGWGSHVRRRGLRFRFSSFGHPITHPQKYRWSATWDPPGGTIIMPLASLR